MEQREQQPRSSTSTALVAALVLMTGVAGLMGYKYYDKAEVASTQEVAIAERVEELASTRVKLDSISNSLDAKIAEVQRLGGDVTELQKVRADLEKDKKALARGARLSRATIASYEGKIQQYMAFLAEKDTLIAQVQREKEVLVVDNQSLNTENVTLKTRRKQLEDTVAVVATQNTELATKVTRAAALKAQNVKIYAVNSRGKVKEDDAYKAKRIDKLKLTYSLLDNPLTAEEPKDVFVRVLDPDGAVVSDMANGSGTFKANGDEMIYTAKQTVNYDKNGQKVEFLYTRGTQYRPGKYTIELYSEGFKIGTGEFAVR